MKSSMPQTTGLWLLFVTALLLAGSPPASYGDSASPTPKTTAMPTTADLLSRMAAMRAGLNSYSVPIHFDLVVRKGVSVSAKLDGTRYFQSPDREVLVMNNMPSIAKRFQYIYSGLGTPQTWPLHYTVTLVSPQPSSDMYELKGVPKESSNVSYVLLDVSRDNLAPIQTQWFYTNGGTVFMHFDNKTVGGKYLLPSAETIDIAFPEYKVHATGHYAEYTINQPIPDAIWQASPQPLPT